VPHTRYVPAVYDRALVAGPDLHLDVRRPRVRASLEDALRRAVADGRLRPGARLPSSRALAEDLRVARNTVADVYGQLVAEGWLTAHRGAGTRVADTPGATAALAARDDETLTSPPPRFDLRAGMPNLAGFPRREWLSAARAALVNASPDVLGYGDPSGRPELRRGLAEYLGRVRGVRTAPDRIVVCSGTIHAFSLLCSVLVEREAAAVAVESLGWKALPNTAEAAGLKRMTLPVDDEGAQVDRLRSAGVDAVLLTPAHQFPTGRVLSPARRHAVIEWARATGGYVVEDDYDGEFRYDRRPVGALQDLDPDRVVYVGTASKSLAPGLRLAWMALPADLVRPVRAALRRGIWQTGVFEQLTLTHFLAGGGYDRHVRRSRLAYRRRRDRLVAAVSRHVPQARIAGIAAGMHALVELPPPLTEQAVLRRAAERGLALDGLTTFLTDPALPCPPSIVVGFGTPADHAFGPSLRVLVDVLRGH
jgi:GntR family transcriptional regulator / MocR family aminotransferase